MEAEPNSEMEGRGRVLLLRLDHHAVVDPDEQTTQGVCSESRLQHIGRKRDTSMAIREYERKSGRYSHPNGLRQGPRCEAAVVVGTRLPQETRS